MQYRTDSTPATESRGKVQKAFQPARIKHRIDAIGHPFQVVRTSRLAHIVVMKILLSVSACLILLVKPAVADLSLPWDSSVELQGSVVQEAFYGPPGYGETPRDDLVEVAYVLHLEHPVTVSGSGEFAHEPVMGQQEIQLVLKTPAMLRDIPSSSCVQLRGKLFGAHTGHHHYPVLMDVESYSLCDQSISGANLQKTATQAAESGYDSSIEGMAWGEKTELRGKVWLEARQGPPGYGKSPHLDLIETIRVLALERPITVNGPSDDNWNAAIDQMKIHLVIMDANMRSGIPLDTCLALNGSLFGSHRTQTYHAVMMSVEGYRHC